MSVELILLPVDHESNSLSYSHQVLQFGSNYDFFDALKKLNSMPVSERFTSYVSQQGYSWQKPEEVPIGTHYGLTTVDDYENEVRYILVEDFINLVDKFPKEDWSKRQRAAIAYIRTLDKRDKIALYFH